MKYETLISFLSVCNKNGVTRLKIMYKCIMVGHSRKDRDELCRNDELGDAVPLRCGQADVWYETHWRRRAVSDQ